MRTAVLPQFPCGCWCGMLPTGPQTRFYSYKKPLMEVWRLLRVYDARPAAALLVLGAAVAPCRR